MRAHTREKDIMEKANNNMYVLRNNMNIDLYLLCTLAIPATILNSYATNIPRLNVLVMLNASLYTYYLYNKLFVYVNVR